MIYEKVARATWSNPMFNYCPSTTTNANGKLCNIIVALNELRMISAHVRYEQLEPSEELMMFGSHVLDWLAPDKKGIGSPGDSNFRHSNFGAFEILLLDILISEHLIFEFLKFQVSTF